VIAWANRQLPEFQHLQAATAVDHIARSPNGKVSRADLRAVVITNTQWPIEPPTQPNPEGARMATVINRLTVTGDSAEFEKIIGQITEYMSAQPGFVEHRLMRSLRRPEIYVEMARWSDADSHRAAMQGEGFRSRVRELSAVATAEPDVFADVD
jgi:long-chain acyl-CoA synthetase